MSIVVEDGSGLANAEALVSVAFVDSYMQNRGDTLWVTMTTTQKEAAIRRASDYLEANFANRWLGYRKTLTQSLSWPRFNVPIRDLAGYAYFDSSTVPLIVMKAVADLSIRAAAGPLAPDISDRLKKRVKVGEIETEYESNGAPYVRFRAIDMALAPLLSGSINSIAVVRG